ncbi:hypothetical protein ABB27_14825 [Stenotrophomonas terrae]|uniref:Glycosyl transferase family 25 domain-containing protein n=1 Tax=Stenotrophomonas terrae TaxID=405446 RepID=A0A0R0C845_9GAMM|nr:glycosyltransferase family 25 protein [Stenotrophomonas terrae]KRG65833.1 hypothetical protein ABB27_14825 [Stenotrophomonas terrae]
MTRPSADLPLYVINLPASADRRASIQRQAAALGIELTLSEAINGSVQHPLFAKVDEKRRLACKGRPFRPGEIGCWASHYLLWQQCVDSGRPMIVFEDDITIDPRFLDVLRDLPLLPDSVGYFRLHAADRPSSPWVQFGDFVLHRYWRSPLCAFGYYLAPSAAEKFLRHADHWVLPVDDYMDLAWLHGVECLGLKPGVVRSGDLFASVIQSGRKAKPGVGVLGWLSRESYRARLSVRWFAHNLVSRLRWRAPTSNG